MLPFLKAKQIAIYGSTVLAVIAGIVTAELYLSYRTAPRVPLPFYNRLYPYVMFRPNESYTFETRETYAMSHHKSRAFVYTNEDGFRIASPAYRLPKEKPPAQLRIAVLGSSQTQLASTYETTLPGSLKALLQQHYPGRDIEVINAGIQSCVSRQSIVQLVTTVVDYHPDIVILYDGTNDIGLPLTYESRPNFPYNFQSMEEAWDLYRREHREPLWRIAAERSTLFRILRARIYPSERKLIPTADEPLAGTNAVPADRLIADTPFRVNHVSAYLSNWRKLIELAAAYHYVPVCILAPAAVFDVNFAVPQMMNSFRLRRETALQWAQALALSYAETDRQIDKLRASYPNVVFVNLARDLNPAEKYFWDLGHVYDEANRLLAEHIYTQMQPAIESSLRSMDARNAGGRPR